MSKIAPIRHQGNENLFLAIEMSIVSSLAGFPLHVHAEGVRGTGKTTVMRWARETMPAIQRVKGCVYQCDPENPHCPVHQLQKGSDFQRESQPMPFVEIGHGAKLGTILGSIDLARLTDPSNPSAALLPGAIPMAHRGVLFVDEVNRLAETAPEITDVLLSVMGTKPGHVKIEETGLPPYDISVQASVWAASNPDEDPGPLENIRKQLADRFDLVVPVQRPNDVAVVEQLLSRKTAKATQSPAGTASWDRLWAKAERLPLVSVPSSLVRYMAQLYVQRNVESLRAIEALELASRLVACIRGKPEISFEDILVATPLVLRHRLDPAVLAEILKDLELRKTAGMQAKPDLPKNGPAPLDQKGQSDEKQDQTPANSAPRFLPAENPIKTPPPTWFGRLVSKFSARAAGNQDTGKRQAAGPMQLPDPGSHPPVSPPDLARPISAIPLDELVVPSDWKGLP